MSGKEQTPVTAMPTANRRRNMGASLNDDTSRLDGIAKVTGRAKYGRDTYLPNSLFIGFIRCPFGAGTLVSIQEKAALAADGVVEVQLNGEEGKYHGHPVGYLVAESKLALQRGLSILQPKWRMDRVKAGMQDTAGKPPKSPDPSSKVKSILDGADHTLEAVYSTPVQTHSSLETHGCSIDHDGDRATVYISTQGTFAARDGMDGPLGLSRSKYEIVCEYIGGGFGSKLQGAGREGVTAAKVAAKYKRPTYLFVDRAEEHLDTGNRPSSRTLVRVGVNNDGTILGGQVHTWGGVGVGGGGGVSVPSRRYNLGNIEKNHDNVRFNGGAPRAFRAPGSPQGAFAEELMLDEVAAMIDLDPLQLRLKLENSDDRREMFEMGAEIIGWKQRKPNGSQKSVLRRGFGLGSSSWGRFPTHTEAEVVVNRDGSVEVRTGTQDIGTGQRTAMAIVAAEGLGAPLEAMEVQIGHSSLPIGPGSGGSMTAHNTAPAMFDAAQEAKKKLLAIIAERLNHSEKNLDLKEGYVFHKGESIMSWIDACSKIGGEHILGRGLWNRKKLRSDSGKGHSEGVQFVELLVDTETGVISLQRIIAIQACGRVICRKTAESQIIGGVLQGLSYALFENKLLDPRIGAMLNPNFEEYKIAGTADTPHIEPVLWTKGQTGVRSLGEPPTIPTSGAIAGALFNALGRPVRHLPLTPDKVLAALEGRVS